MKDSDPSLAEVGSTHIESPFNTLPNDLIVDKSFSDVGEAVWPAGRKFSSSCTPILRGSCRVIGSTPKPCTIPLYIPLGPNLTHPAKITCAEAEAKHLSGKCGRAVELSELEGLFLYLWSQDDPDGRALADYLGDNRRSLQALLLEIRNLEGKAEALASAELLGFVRQRFEI